MCRWMAYSGGPIRLQQLLFEAPSNLIDQSLSSRSAETPTNGDGFGIGWYDKFETPGLFHSIRPAWNDFNLRDLAAHIESPLFMAHVRATSLATIQETNCHPFRYKNWLFVHNGEIFEIEKFRRDLIVGVDPLYFNNILGSTDSELMFHLALSFGLEKDVVGSVARMVHFVEETGKKYGVHESVWMTLGISDGKTLYGFRYASDGKAPTLFVSPTVDEVYKLNPGKERAFGESARAIVSEPIGKYPELWNAVPESSTLLIEKGKVTIAPFQPATAT